MKKILQASTTDLILVVSFYEQDWHMYIIQNLSQPFIIVGTKNLKDFDR